MDRPSSMAETIVAKLSSARIMSAASLATSVPEIPMAIPIEACLRAGASLTPSPVMAGTSPHDRRIFTSNCLSRGSVREKTREPPPCMIKRARSSSLMDPWKNSAPVNDFPATLSPSSKIPTSRAMASAVVLLSPVIIMTRTPAFWQHLMADRTSGRGGSLIPVNPTKVSPDSTPAYSSRFNSWEGSSSLGGMLVLMAIPSTRRGRLDMSVMRAVKASRSVADIVLTDPSGRMRLVHRSNKSSAAPLTSSTRSPVALFLHNTDMDLRSRLNSRVASLSKEPWINLPK
mmetsp:Transcript_8199/g.20311  ORF Transcript_8199/g.20311 Transcript_8199/m.20311 type:complete len:287 (-) Transcript_8199:1623-2483(-)